MWVQYRANKVVGGGNSIYEGWLKSTLGDFTWKEVVFTIRTVKNWNTLPERLHTLHLWWYFKLVKASLWAPSWTCFVLGLNHSTIQVLSSSELVYGSVYLFLISEAEICYSWNTTFMYYHQALGEHLMFISGFSLDSSSICAEWKLKTIDRFVRLPIQQLLGY